MSDHTAPQGASDRRRRSNNRRRGGNASNRGSGNRSGASTFRPNRAPKQTAFQKILSLLTFGLLGKPKSAAKSRPQREPTSNVTIVSSKKSDSTGSRDRDRDRPRREPAPADPSSVISERLYVGNLSYDASESDLFELFNGVGGVRNAEVVVNNRTQRSKGFAFVTMSSVEEARRAVIELHGKDFMGRPLQLSGAKPSQNRDEASEDSAAETEEATA